MERAVLTLLSTLMIAATWWTPATARTPVSSVGSAGRDFVDDTRMNWAGTGPRPMTTVLWYPTDVTSVPTTPPAATTNPNFVALPATVENAPLSNSRRSYPLVLISHGTGGSALGMMWLGYYLASHGYIVAALNHHGNTGAEPAMDPRGFLLYWERSKDLSAVLDRLLQDPKFGPHIDPNSIGAAGFSLGGYTVIAVAGARFNRAEFDRFCSSPERDFTCGPQPEFPDAPKLFQAMSASDPAVRASLARAGDSYRDPRVKAVFAIAPVFGRGFTPSDVTDVDVPIQIVVGKGDTVAPPKTNAQRYAAILPGAKLQLLGPSVTHYTFVPQCTAQGKKVLVRLCYDAPGLDRHLVQLQISELATDFFDRSLLRH